MELDWDLDVNLAGEYSIVWSKYVWNQKIYLISEILGSMSIWFKEIDIQESSPIRNLKR